MARDLEAHVEGAGEDVLAVWQLPATQALAAGDAPDEANARQLRTLFAAELAAKSHFVQLRFIDRQGLEIVRVGRSGPVSSVRVVPNEDLQPKVDRPYVTETFARPPGSLYVSRIELNQEFGVIEMPFLPVLRVATALPSGSRDPGGMVIVNVDMRSVLSRIRAAVGGERQLYVISDVAQYLIHPDEAREFELDRGLDGNAWDDFPEIPRSLPVDSVFTGLVASATEPVGMAALVVRPADGPPITLILTEPGRALLAGQAPVIRSVFVGGSLIALASGFLALALARSLTRPVEQMVVAVRRFESTGDWSAPPVSGELALLSERLGGMIETERDRTQALKREVQVRKEAEDALAREAASLRLLSAMAQSSADAIYTKTLDGDLTSWNPGAEQIYGYKKDEVLGRSVRMLVPPDREAEFEGIMTRLRRGESIRELETVRFTKDGRTIHVSLTLSPVNDDEGVQIGASVIARDITRRKNLEERFRLSVEASPNGMVVVDAEGRIVLVNRETERLFGYSRDELAGANIDLLVPGSARGDHASQRANYLAHPSKRAMGSGRALFGRREDGSEIPVEIGLNPIETPDGLLVLASIVDISERQRVLAELQRSNSELEQFAYVASHDLQEPLRMVASYTALLEQRYRGQLDDRADKYIHYAVDGAKRMQLLINDLLLFSRVTTHAKPFAPTDTGALVGRVVGTALRAAVEESGARIDVGELPVVMADEVQLTQVFQNLISNALKFRADDRPPVVSVSASREGAAWRFSVKDNGIGIEAQYRDRVFEMFQRLHGIGSYPGSGIGLTLARKIVLRHGGAIWFESEPGSSTTFHFTVLAHET